MKNFKIVNLRAFAIITVVIGHSIILYSSKWNIIETTVSFPLLDKLKEFINLYQMQLYFFISGFLCYYGMKKTNYYSFLKKKSKRLLIPYFVFGLLWMIPIKLAIGFYDVTQLKRILFWLFIGKNNGHLWFLYSLFVVFALSFPVNKIVLYNKKNGFLVLIATFVISCFDLNVTWFDIGMSLKYLFWFEFGFLVNLLGGRKLWMLSLLFVAAIWGCFTESNVFYSMVIVVGLFSLIPNTYNKILEEIDNNSFGIYLLHSPLVYITYTYMTNMSPFIVVSINIVVCGFIAFALTRVIKNSKINNYLKI